MADRDLLIDVSRSIWRRWRGGAATGIDRVCDAYIARYAGRAQAVIQHDRWRGIVNVAASKRLFSLLSDRQRPFRPAFLHWLAGAGLWRDEPAGGRLYLNLGHTGLDRSGLRHWVQRSGARAVYFVHDLIPLTHPDTCREGEATRHRARMLGLLESAHGVIGNSQATLDELADFARGEGRVMSPALAAWLGATPFAAAPTLPADVHFLVLGTIEARKNHALLLDLWDEFARQRDIPARLLIVGRRGWRAQDVTARLDALAGDHTIVEMGPLDDAALAPLLGSARALLFPTLAEGYGLPLVEALGAGVPVIASDLAVFRETGQGVPLLIDAQDRAGWARAIRAYAADNSLERARQVAAMADFVTPSWDAHFARVDPFLARL